MGGLFGNNPQHSDKALILDLVIVKPREYLADAVERKNNTCLGSFPATYFLLPLPISTCGELDPDVHVLIKDLAIRRANGGGNSIS